MIELRGHFDYQTFFMDVSELEPIDRIILSSGPMNGIRLEKEVIIKLGFQG